jgi:hypothetical protein
MLQLIISVLLSFGFSLDESGKLTGSGTNDKNAAYQQIKANSEYERLGGDLAFDIVVPDVDPK